MWETSSKAHCMLILPQKLLFLPSYSSDCGSLSLPLTNLGPQTVCRGKKSEQSNLFEEEQIFEGQCVKTVARTTGLFSGFEGALAVDNYLLGKKESIPKDRKWSILRCHFTKRWQSHPACGGFHFWGFTSQLLTFSRSELVATSVSFHFHFWIITGPQR